MNVQHLKLPPHSVDAEQAILGGLLQDNTAYDRIADTLTEADFYRQEHRLIYRAALGLINGNKPADVVTVAERLDAEGILQDVGGLPYLVDMVNNSTAANVRSYAGIVRERSILRKLAEVGSALADSVYSPAKSASVLLAEAQQTLSEMETKSASAEAKPIADALRGMIERIDATYHGGVKALKTGFKDLDEKIVGLEPGDSIILAGRPAMGKTAFGLQIANHVAESAPVLVFSLEMPAQQLAMRETSRISNIDLMKLRTAKLGEEDWQKLTYAVGKLNTRNLFIDDRSGLNMQQIRARARQVKRQHGLGLIVIDYLQLIAGEGENQNTKITNISQQIKLMARELGVPVITLSQLNRDLERRTNKRPTMADLRDSGAIEQDADVVLFLYRDEYYNLETTWKGVAECIIGKQRNGPVGFVLLTYISERAMFGDFTGRYTPYTQAKRTKGFDE